MSNESITITQSINSVTVAAGGSVGLNAGGLIQGNLEVDGNVVIDGLLTVGADTDGKDVRFWGETASKYTLWDASQDKLIITGELQVDGEDALAPGKHVIPALLQSRAASRRRNTEHAVIRWDRW